MQLEEHTKKECINTLKNKCDAMNSKLTSIESMTANRWKNIDKVIDKFIFGIALILILNITILAAIFCFCLR